MPALPAALVSFAAPEDSSLLAQWEKHLLPLQQAGRITTWSEQHILPGDRREEQITRHLEQADLIVLLLSADFFADRECYGLMARSLQRSQSSQARVIPLLLRPVDWRSSPIGQFTCLPTNGRPITRWGNRDEAFQDCVKSITALLAPSVVARQPSAPRQSSASAQQRQPSSISHHSCFISYSSKDEALAQRLHADLTVQGVDCWFAPHDMKIGARIRSTIDQAIGQQDKLLLLLSQHSIESDWVEDEVESALERERDDHREMLFPIRLDNAVAQPDAPAWAKRLRRQVNIGDFSNWNDPQAYQQAFERLLHDLENADSGPANAQQYTHVLLPEFEEIDNLVMKLLCENAFANGSYWVNIEQLRAQAKAAGIEWDLFLESMRVLEQQHSLEITEAEGGHIALLKLRTDTFEKYAQAHIPNYQESKIALIRQMLQNSTQSNKELSSQLHQPLVLCDHILRYLEAKNLIKIMEMLDSTIRIQNISAELRRASRNEVLEDFLKRKGI